MSRPSLFVGSSSEGLRIAQTVQVLLEPICEVTLWTQGVFGLGQGTLESLVMAIPDFDFAVLVLTADDLRVSHGAAYPVARDNVLFELGLFIGGLGRERTFILYDRTMPPMLPSDLAGVTAVTFAPHANGNLQAAMGAACTKIQDVVERTGVRPTRSLQDLQRAARDVEGVSATMQALIRLLARSRKVELDVILTQFGALIGPDNLQRIRQDLADLDMTLAEKAAVPADQSDQVIPHVL